MNSKLFFFSFLFCFFAVHSARSQSSTADTVKRVEILGSDKLVILEINDSTQLQILAGKVRLKQGTTLFYCDSCVINNTAHIFEAIGHVHINDADTANAYSD